MRVAWHPAEDRFILAKDLEKEFGNRLALDGDLYLKPMARCKVCSSRLTLISGNPTRVAHFRHAEGINCPTSEPAGRPYLRLTPTDPDPERGRQLRQEVFERHQDLHVEMQHLVPFFSVSEFRTLLRRATERRVWDYRNLTFGTLPKTLVMLADYGPSSGLPGRQYWFRFWFDHEIRDIDRLWIEPNTDPSLFRASFKPPSAIGARPAYEDIKKIAEYPWDRPAFLPGLSETESQNLRIRLPLLLRMHR